VLRILALLLLFAWAAPQVAAAMVGVDACSSACSETGDDCSPACQSCGCASHVPRVPGPSFAGFAASLLAEDVHPVEGDDRLIRPAFARDVFHPPRAG
jgi:hypothetical protein